MYLIEPELYVVIYYNIVLFFTVINAFKISKSYSDNIYLNSFRNYSCAAWIFSCLFIFFLGLRPVHQIFTDTINYANAYKTVQMSDYFYFDSGDLGFKYLMLFLSYLGLSVKAFFLIIESIYIGCYCYICNRLFGKNSFLALLVVMGTFFFFDFGVNVIRNGMALSLMFLAIYLFEFKHKNVTAIFIFALSLCIHISCALVLCAYIVSKYYPNTKFYLFVWSFCLCISILFGRDLESLLTTVGVLDNWRSGDYLVGENRDMSVYAINGFRWDFLLFSLLPLLWGYYIICKQTFKDEFYTILYNIYVCCNAFWLIVNQNWLSNRFAMLSWFVYSVLIIYPLLRAELINKRKLFLICYMLGNVLFGYVYNVF